MDLDLDVAKRAREFAYTDTNFIYLSTLVKARSGINLSDAKHELVYGRVAKRLRRLGFTTFDQYCDFLEQGNEEELTHFINAITTNVTDFFRENHHFEFLSETWLSELMADKTEGSNNRRLRIWSAGCSSGEEPYSIAITLRESIPDIHRWDIKILATDLDSSIVEKAQAGIYPLERVKNLPKAHLKRWFRLGLGGNTGTASVSDEIKSMVTFKTLNLTEDWPMKGPFDAIFCRNVIIYFDKPTRTTMINRFEEMLEVGAYFFIGHSESLFGANKNFKLVGRTIHRKIDS
ncbi:MAG: protein-glutamate O-methyltransferase [Porticoccaceae bacterium]